MPVEQVRISFYKMRKCGFFGWGAAEPAFGSLADTMAQLAQWSDGMALGLTKIANPGGREPSHPVYLAGIHQRARDWVFATWNEVPAHDGEVASVSINSVVGDPEVHMNAIVANSIPGFATYFWVLPDLGVLASIRFTHAATGHGPMCGYLERFLAVESNYAVAGEDEVGNRVILGYTDQDDNVPKKLWARVRSEPYAKRGQRRFLLNNWHRITKVIRRGSLDATKPANRRWWQGMASFLHAQPQDGNGFVSAQAYVELQYTPTEDELAAMFDAEDAETHDSPWDDLGFQLQNDSNKIHWIGRSRASDVFQLDVVRQNAEMVDLDSLARALSGQRTRILRLLEEDEDA
ncbi:hypothetical protein SGO26_09285 [Cupriavidus metallidurans]|uniref:hypothetical protein n=1 Tax=Cupriavidus TaxID=106589 RepID=UPI0025A8E625|nr:hypothetical protein [Cupriavidus sp. TKC]GMG90244.1 hypothetical protein Cmtc_14640 [Cupriavidus sp. TKC]